MGDHKNNRPVTLWVLAGVAGISVAGVGYAVRSLGDHERAIYGHAGGLVIKEKVENLEQLVAEVRADVKENQRILIRLDERASTP